MNELEKTKAFMEAAAYEEKRCGCLDLKNGFNPFVTVSRQAGAGANSLAAAILDILQDRRDASLFQGWQKFNQELCRKIAEEPGLNVSIDKLMKFEYRSQIDDMMDEIIAGGTPQDAVNKKIFHLIRTLAAFGKVILIGRGGVCLTRGLPLGIHIRLVAPLEIRVRRMAGLLGLSEKKAVKLVRDQDKSRALLMKTYFNKDIDDPLLYDAVWNTGTVSMEDIARSIVLMIEKKWCLCKKQPLFHKKEAGR